MSPTTRSPGVRAASESGPQSAAWTVEALRSVWEHQQERVSDRISVIEGAITALANNRLDAGLRQEAERAAHMLAGSIGTFGFVDASDAAHELELELTHPIPDCTPALSALLLRLQSGVQGPVVLCADDR